MAQRRKASRKRVRRVVSRLEDEICESPELEGIYGERASSPAEVARVLFPLTEHEPTEVFLVLLLNGKHRVSGIAEASRGTLTSSLVHPREVFGPAIRQGAAAVIVAHNHPSGDPEPSVEDLSVTRRLKEVGDLLGIPLLDHVILGARGSFTSLRERMSL